MGAPDWGAPSSAGPAAADSVVDEANKAAPKNEAPPVLRKSRRSIRGGVSSMKIAVGNTRISAAVACMVVELSAFSYSTGPPRALKMEHRLRRDLLEQPLLPGGTIFGRAPFTCLA